MENIIFSMLLPVVIIIAFLGTLVYQIFFAKSEKKKLYKVAYESDNHNSSLQVEEEFKILENNHIEPNYLSNRIGLHNEQ